MMTLATLYGLVTCVGTWYAIARHMMTLARPSRTHVAFGLAYLAWGVASWVAVLTT